MKTSFNCIKPQRNWMNGGSWPAVSIRGRAGGPSGQAKEVVEINHFRPTRRCGNSTSVKFLIACERDCRKLS